MIKKRPTFHYYSTTIWNTQTAVITLDYLHYHHHHHAHRHYSTSFLISILILIFFESTQLNSPLKLTHSIHSSLRKRTFPTYLPSYLFIIFSFLLMLLLLILPMICSRSTLVFTCCFGLLLLNLLSFSTFSAVVASAAAARILGQIRSSYDTHTHSMAFACETIIKLIKSKK